MLNYSKIAEPMTRMLWKDNKTKWGDAQIKAFKELKAQFTEGKVLGHYDPTQDSVVETDALDQALGACLMQKERK